MACFPVFSAQISYNLWIFLSQHKWDLYYERGWVAVLYDWDKKEMNGAY